MNLIKYPDDMIKRWDKQVRNLMAYKLKENQFIGCAHWYLPNKNYGYNLFKLKDLRPSIHSSEIGNSPYPFKIVRYVFKLVRVSDQFKLIQTIQINLK